MVKITNEEAKYLREHGVKFGNGGLDHTWSHNRHYYLCESFDNLKLLKEYRDSKIVK